MLEKEPAWGRFLAEVRAFLSEGIVEEAPQPTASVFPEFTPREYRTRELIALGLDNQQIAERLVVTLKAIRNYTSRIDSKLGARNLGQAIVLARDAGLGQMPDQFP